MKKGMMAGFIARFEDILEALDGLETDEAMDEEMEELNAQLEDAIFLLDSVDVDDEDAAEEMEGALSEIIGVAEDYATCAAADTKLGQLALELKMAAQMAAKNIGAAD